MFLSLFACESKWKRGEEEKVGVSASWDICVVYSDADKGRRLSTPSLLLTAFVFGKIPERKISRKKTRKISAKWMITAGVLAVVLLALCIYKFMPVICRAFCRRKIYGGRIGVGTSTIPYLLAHPLKVVYLFTWNTLMK